VSLLHRRYKNYNYFSMYLVFVCLLLLRFIGCLLFEHKCVEIFITVWWSEERQRLMEMHLAGTNSSLFLYPHHQFLTCTLQVTEFCPQLTSYTILCEANLCVCVIVQVPGNQYPNWHIYDHGICVWRRAVWLHC